MRPRLARRSILAAVSNRSEADWVALNLLRELGPLRTRRLLERFGDPGYIARRLPQRQLEQGRVGPKAVARIVAARHTLERTVERELKRVRESSGCA